MRSPARAILRFELPNGGSNLFKISIFLIGFAVVAAIDGADPRIVLACWLMIPCLAPLGSYFSPYYLDSARHIQIGSASESFGMSAFLATRPVSTAVLAGAKGKAALLSSFASSALGAATVVLFLLLDPRDTRLARDWGALLRDLGLLKSSAAILATAFTIGLLTWNNELLNLLVQAAEQRPTRALFRPLLFASYVFMIGPLQLAIIIANQDDLVRIMHLLTLASCAVAILKVVLGLRRLQIVVQRKLLLAAAGIQLVAIWIFTVACIVAVSWWLLPGEAAPILWISSSVVLIVPLASPLILLYILDQCRHR